LTRAFAQDFIHDFEKQINISLNPIFFRIVFIDPFTQGGPRTRNLFAGYVFSFDTSIFFHMLTQNRRSIPTIDGFTKKPFLQVRIQEFRPLSRFDIPKDNRYFSR